MLIRSKISDIIHCNAIKLIVHIRNIFFNNSCISLEHESHNTIDKIHQGKMIFYHMEQQCLGGISLWLNIFIELAYSSNIIHFGNILYLPAFVSTRQVANTKVTMAVVPPCRTATMIAGCCWLDCCRSKDETSKELSYKWFVAHHWNLVNIFSRLSHDSNYWIRSKSFMCHDSSAAGTNPRLWHDLIISFPIKVSVYQIYL